MLVLHKVGRFEFHDVRIRNRDPETGNDSIGGRYRCRIRGRAELVVAARMGRPQPIIVLLLHEAKTEATAGIFKARDCDL